MIAITRFLATLAIACGGLAAESAPRPDIAAILADDIGSSDAGCYGGEIPTPVLDGLASNGLRFTRFYNSARG